MRRPKLCVLRYPLDEAKPFRYWTISGYRVDGKRKRLFFKDQKEARKQLAEIERLTRREGTAARHLSEHDRVTAVRCMDELKPYRKSLRDAVDHYLTYLQSSAKKNIPVSELVPAFLAEKEQLHRSVLHCRDLQGRLSRFARDFGSRTVREIEEREIRAWLRGLKLQPQSQRNYQGRLINFFGYAMREGYADTNPAKGIELE